MNVYDVKINNAAATGTLPVENGVTGAWTGTGDYVRAFGADPYRTLTSDIAHLSHQSNAV